MDNPTDHLAAVRAAPVTNQNDHLTAVRAALDLMLRVWPGSLDVRRFVDDAGNDAAAVIDKATGETIAICDNEDRDDHAAPAEDAAAIVALRNAAPAIAALADECAAARDRIATLEAELAQARAHRCGGIVLSAEDADRIAALLEDPPAPTPAMVALFAKAKE